MKENSHLIAFAAAEFVQAATFWGVRNEKFHSTGLHSPGKLTISKRGIKRCLTLNYVWLRVFLTRRFHSQNDKSSPRRSAK